METIVKSWLEKQIEKEVKKINPDSYPVSIWEIVNMYRDWDIEIAPDFQRLFRWDKEQKSRLIESIFLWLPLPSFFVSTDEKRRREIIDWLQRISTILEFLQVLNEENIKKMNSKNSITDGLVNSEGFKYLSKLGWLKWNDLSDELQREFKRYKLNFNILKVSSDKSAKYELFQRLNTWWSQLSWQEVRSCIMIMENKKLFDFIEEISKNEDFSNCISSISDEDLEKQYDKELILRFFCLVNNKLNSFVSVNDFISGNMQDFLHDFYYDYNKNIFENVFKILNETFGENVFKRLYEDGKFKRRVLIPVFDIVTLRTQRNLSKATPETLKELIRVLWEDTTFNEKIGIGPSIESKLKYALKDAQTLLDKKFEWIIVKK